VVYGTSTVKRSRRSKAEVEQLEEAIYVVAAAEKPCTIRGVFYRVMSQGMVPKSEPGYRQVQSRVLLSSKTAKADAAKAGIRERTLQRAVKSLGVSVESRGFPRVTWWELSSPANDVTNPPAIQNLGATGATGDDLQERNGATGPNIQSRQLIETGATAPGGLTESTPGQTDRVQRSLAKARASGRSCDSCGKTLLPTNTTGRCAECRLIASNHTTEETAL
jgi:hypothetical protein